MPRAFLDLSIALRNSVSCLALSKSGQIAGNAEAAIVVKQAIDLEAASVPYARLPEEVRLLFTNLEAAIENRDPSTARENLQSLYDRFSDARQLGRANRSWNVSGVVLGGIGVIISSASLGMSLLLRRRQAGYFAEGQLNRPSASNDGFNLPRANNEVNVW